MSKIKKITAANDKVLHLKEVQESLAWIKKDSEQFHIPECAKERVIQSVIVALKEVEAKILAEIEEVKI